MKIVGHVLLWLGLLALVSGGANVAVVSKSTGAGRAGEWIGVALVSTLLIIPGVVLINRSRLIETNDRKPRDS